MGECVSRQIKFRAKRMDMDRWVFGEYFRSPLTDENSGAPAESGWFFLAGETRHCIAQDGVAFAIDPATIGQYTGLVDGDGNDIYEGDVVQFTRWWFDGVERDTVLTGTVVYMASCMSYGLRGVKNADWIRHIGGGDGDSDAAPFATWVFDETDFRVLGNIHDSPGLAKEAPADA